MLARQIEDAATNALKRGNHREALAQFRMLEELEPDEPAWSKKVANLCERLGQKDECFEALTRAAARYAKRNDRIKAMAMSKMAIELKPEHRPTLDLLDKLARSHRTSHQRSRDRKLSGIALADDSGSQPMAVISLIRSVRTEPTAKQLGPLRRAETPEASPFHSLTQDLMETEPAFEEPGALPPIPLFSALSATAFRNLTKRSRLFDLKKGERLFRQGDRGTSLYVVIDGSVQVSLEQPQKVVLSQLSSGDFFGEIALFTDRVRGASITANEETQLLEVSRKVIHDVIRDEPQVLDELLRFLRERLVKTLVETSPFFQRFSSADRGSLTRYFRLVDVEANTLVLQQGKPARGLFVLVDGTLEVIRQLPNGDSVVATLEPGHVCGEISLLTQLPAVTTVLANKKCLLLMLPAPSFQEAILTHPEILSFATDLATKRMKELERLSEPPGADELVRWV